MRGAREGGDARVVLDTPDDEGELHWTGDRLLFTRTPIGHAFVAVDVGALLDRAGGG